MRFENFSVYLGMNRMLFGLTAAPKKHFYRINVLIHVGNYIRKQGDIFQNLEAIQHLEDLEELEDLQDLEELKDLKDLAFKTFI